MSLETPVSKSLYTVENPGEKQRPTLRENVGLGRSPWEIGRPSYSALKGIHAQLQKVHAFSTAHGNSLNAAVTVAKGQRARIFFHLLPH